MGLGLMVWGVRFRRAGGCWGTDLGRVLGFRVSCFGFMLTGFRFLSQGLGFSLVSRTLRECMLGARTGARVQGFGVQGLGFGF